MTTFTELLTTIEQVRAATLVHFAAECDPEIKAGMEINLDLMTRALNDAGWPVDDDDDGPEMHDDSCGECGHPYKRGDETHYPECSRVEQLIKRKDEEYDDYAS